MPEIFSASAKETSPQKEGKTLSGFWTRKSLSAFLVRPTHVHFETQDEKEDILLFLRQHPITNAGWIVTVLLLAITPIIFTSLVFPNGISFKIPEGLFVLLPLLWYLGTFGYGFANFLSWYFNVNIVTNERIIDIDWKGLLFRQHSSTQVERIQDVTYKQAGILDSFFDYGSVFVQTAGTEPNFEFHHIPRPNEVATQINKLLESKQESHKSK